MTMFRAILCGAAVAAGAGVLADAAGVTQPSLTRPFAAGGRVWLTLDAGQYVIRGTPAAQVAAKWTTREPDDLRRVTVSARIDGTTAYVNTDRGSVDGLHADVDVPARSDVTVRLTAGDLTVTGVNGSLDVSAWAGHMRIGVASPSEYHSVNASVTAGDIRAEPFSQRTSGLLRSISWQGPGRYDIRVRLTAGQMTFESTAPQTSAR